MPHSSEKIHDLKSAHRTLELFYKSMIDLDASISGLNDEKRVAIENALTSIQEHIRNLVKS